MIRRLCLLIIAVYGLAVAPAHAKQWTTDYANSHIGFTGTQGSSSFDGGFKKYTLIIDFDPLAPQNGKIVAAIDMSSAFAGSDDRDKALPQPEWFNSSKFSQAQFISTAIQVENCKAQAASGWSILGCYQMSGTLNIKGIARQVVLPFILTERGNTVHAQGKIVLMRTDFGVGEGQWADTSFVKNEVDVVIDVTAN